MTQSAYTLKIAEWIAEQRNELSISQAELAIAIGVSQASIVNWERGASTLSAYSYAKLKAYFKQQRSARGLDAKAEAAAR
jgi:DNA-binding XRE family transcriptional regulator